MDSWVPDAMQRKRALDEALKLIMFLFYFATGRRTSPLTKSTKNPLCEHSEDSAAGEEDARWSHRRRMTHV